jgi:peptide methionine sulfoxide reductase msrA/msrB
MKPVTIAVLVVFVLGCLVMAAAALGLARFQPEKESMKTQTKAPAYSKSGYDIQPLSKQKIDELATKLTDDEAKVILAKGTEPAFCGNLLDNKKDGVYVCKLCGLPLFSSDAKFNSGTGWPSFFQPFDKDHVAVHSDTSHGMVRDEILCQRCGGHLGHVFNDGPKPTGLRFCLNSVSLDFVEKKDGKLDLPKASQPIKTETAYFAGGCFWGVEDHFQQVPGVIDAMSGYMGGKTKNPSYEDVCSHTTEHAETVKVVYDPAKVAYGDLLTWFFKLHDPTQLNRQGPDVGDSYRSAIFASDEKQLEAAKKFIQEQQKTSRFAKRTIVTQVILATDKTPFYPAESYHQDYHAKHGGSCALPTE